MSLRYIYIVIISILVIGCGTNKKVTERNTQKNNPKTKKKQTLTKKKEAFIVFDIASTDEYIATFKDVAMNNMRDFGIPASIILAQGILESASGKGELTRKTNNHFGIKCHKGWEGDRDYHDDDEKGECFRKYNHPMYSFKDHAMFLTTRSRYDFLFDLRQNDYKGWARGLKKAGYATDRKYPYKLISIIERYKLYKYDIEVLRKKGEVVKPVTEEFQIHKVVKGDTLYSISRKYGLSIERLMRLNNLSSTTISIGQELKIKSSK